MRTEPSVKWGYLQDLSLRVAAVRLDEARQVKPQAHSCRIVAKSLVGSVPSSVEGSSSRSAPTRLRLVSTQ